MSASPRSLPPAPASLYGPGGYAFGRFHGAIAAPTIATKGAQRFRLKEWHYLSLVTDDWFVAVGVVQLGYAAQLFAYAVDRAAPAEPREMERISPLGRALRFAPSTLRGETRFDAGGSRVTIACGDGFDVALDVDLRGERLRGRVRIDPSLGLALAFPLAKDRPAYTHKAAGMRAMGTLALGGRTILEEGTPALAVSDFTRSLANRHTRWKWASLAHTGANGRPIGLNLSAEVYDDATGDSQENALFVGDETLPLEGVRFTLPPDPRRDPWQIESLRGDEVDLRFMPLGARAQNLDLGVLRTRFVQPYGTFHGRVRDERLDGAFGVVEDHDSVW